MENSWLMMLGGVTEGEFCGIRVDNRSGSLKVEDREGRLTWELLFLLLHPLLISFLLYSNSIRTNTSPNSPVLLDADTNSIASTNRLYRCEVNRV